MTLKETLCQALDTLGADSSAYEFDDHSTIVMSFDDVGDIYLDPVDNGKVWLWGMIEPVEENARGVIADALLAEVIRPAPHWEAGALVLRADGRTGGLLQHEYATEPVRLAEALQDFHECLSRLQAIK
ncbi:InvB/SpaK family type III secretion system chaperone [Xanthomonas sp. 60]